MKITINNPCHENWNEMTGEEQKRFCSSCQKHVLNLSEMTQRAAERTLETVDKPCVRYQPDRRGHVKFRHSFPILALLSTGCSYVAPVDSSDSWTSKVNKTVRRGTAEMLHDTFGRVRGPKVSDGAIETGWRRTARAISRLSEGVLYKPASIGVVMGEMVEEPVPVPTWEEKEQQELDLTVPNEIDVGEQRPTE